MPDPTSPAALFASLLRVRREAAWLSVDELADAAGVSKQTVYQLERGLRVPTWPTVVALADALGVSTEAFRTPGE